MALVNTFDKQVVKATIGCLVTDGYGISYVASALAGVVAANGVQAGDMSSSGAVMRYAYGVLDRDEDSWGTLYPAAVRSAALTLAGEVKEAIIAYIGA